MFGRRSKKGVVFLDRHFAHLKSLLTFEESLGYRAPAQVLLIPHMLPGVELGADPSVFHRVDQRVERAAASALLAFVGTCQRAVFFAKQYLLALMTALDRSDDGCSFHLDAPSKLSMCLFEPESWIRLRDRLRDAISTRCKSCAFIFLVYFQEVINKIGIDWEVDFPVFR